MRVISGSLKGRKILGYDILGTRPTMARVKESLFAMIQNKISNAIVLDLFAGSGNYGIEAYSNGAKEVYLNDINHKCINIIKENLRNLEITEYFKISQQNYQECLNTLKKKNIQFDLVFLDPPYALDVCPEIMTFIKNNNLLKKDGLIICEINNYNAFNNYHDLKLVKSKKYGEKYVLIYQNDI